MLAMTAVDVLGRTFLLSRSGVVAVPVFVSVPDNSRQSVAQGQNLLLDDPLNSIEAHLQNVHSGAVAQSDVLVTRRVEQISSLAGVEVEENTRDNNDLLFQTSLEEVQAVIDALRQRRQVQPQVEGAVGNEWDLEAHRSQSINDVISLLAEVMLQGAHLVLDFSGLEHGDSSFLERYVGTSVEVRTARADGLDELLGSDNPGNSPTRETEALCETINDQNIYPMLVQDCVAIIHCLLHTIFVHVFNVVSGRNNSTIAVASVVVSAIELIHDQGCTISACDTLLVLAFQNLSFKLTDVLDLGKLRICQDLTCRVARI